jgi:hypothetical protein
MRQLVRRFTIAALLASPAWAEAPSEPPAVEEPVIAVVARPPCAGDDAARGLPEGPVALGFVEADLATGRRACPRTEAGLGARFGAIIDTPRFYGSLGVNGVLFGSWAFRPDAELFATLEAVNFNYTVNAVLSATQLTLGNMTVGATYAFLQRETILSSVSARLLLPTSLEVPGAHPVGGELGVSVSYRPKGWLEVHAYLGSDVTSAFSRANPYTRLGGILLAGAQLRPVPWFAFVLDLNGRAGALTYFAPSAAVRFRVARLGIEVGATLPVVGTDRHDFLAAARFGWRID